MQTDQRPPRYHKWLVFLSSYMVMVISIGYFHSKGPLFVIIMRRFNSNRVESALINSLNTTIVMGTGFFFGMLIHRLGPSRVCMVGCLFATISMVVSAFATSITYLVISAGIFLSLGLSPMFIGCVTATAQHFEGSPALSIVLSVLSTGSSVGGAIYPYLVQYLDETYGLPGIFFIVAGLNLHGFASALLWTRPPKNKVRPMEPSMKYSKQEETTTILDENLKKSEQSPHNPTENHLTNGDFKRLNGGSGYIEMRARLENGDSKQECLIYDCPKAKQDGWDKIGFKQEYLTKDESKQEHQLTNGSPKPVSLNSVVDSQQKQSAESKTPKTAQRSALLGSVKHLARQRIFWAFCLGIGFSFAAMNVLPLVVVDIFTDNGFEDADANLSLIFYNIFSILGRLSTGVFMKLPNVPTLTTPILATLLGAVAMVGMVFVKSLIGCILLMCIFGYGMGLFLASFSVTTSRLFGVQHLSNAVGILFTINGIGNAIGGTVSGHIRDETESYTVPLLAAATMCMMGFTLFLTIHRCRQNTKNKTYTLPQPT